MNHIKLTILTFLISTSAIADTEKASTLSPNLFRCSEVLKQKSTKTCTDLVHLKRCEDGSRVERGEYWMDEQQSSYADQVYVTDPELCLDLLTDVATKAGCCGG